MVTVRTSINEALFLKSLVIVVIEALNANILVADFTVFHGTFKTVVHPRRLEISIRASINA